MRFFRDWVPTGEDKWVRQESAPSSVAAREIRVKGEVDSFTGRHRWKPTGDTQIVNVDTGEVIQYNRACGWG